MLGEDSHLRHHQAAFSPLQYDSAKTNGAATPVKETLTSDHNKDKSDRENHRTKHLFNGEPKLKTPDEEKIDREKVNNPNKSSTEDKSSLIPSILKNFSFFDGKSKQLNIKSAKTSSNNDLGRIFSSEEEKAPPIPPLPKNKSSLDSKRRESNLKNFEESANNRSSIVYSSLDRHPKHLYSKTEGEIPKKNFHRNCSSLDRQNKHYKGRRAEEIPYKEFGRYLSLDRNPFPPKKVEQYSENLIEKENVKESSTAEKEPRKVLSPVDTNQPPRPRSTTPNRTKSVAFAVDDDNQPLPQDTKLVSYRKENLVRSPAGIFKPLELLSDKDFGGPWEISSFEVSGFQGVICTSAGLSSVVCCGKETQGEGGKVSVEEALQKVVVEELLRKVDAMGASGGAGAGAKGAVGSEAESCGGGACRKILSGRHQTPAAASTSTAGQSKTSLHQQSHPPRGVGDSDPAKGGSQSNRSQPAIGLKQTPKARPTIFGTVASDQTPKDGSSRRSLPQTPQAGKSFSALLNGGAPGDRCCSVESGPEPGHEPDNALVYRDGGNLVSGSLDALVQHMVPTADYYPDRAYLFAFLLSSRLFIKPHELLGEVCELCDQQQKLGDKHGPAKERLGRFVPHLVQLLAEWTETFPYDFRDERVMAHVRSLTQKCVTIEPGVRKEVSTLLQNLLHRLTTLEKYEEFLHRVNSESSTSCVDSLSTMDVTELCPNPALLAQQLTHIELERLSYIGPEEFVQAFAKENPHLETSFKDMKKTRNLESYVQWFNRLSYFVATEVCKHVKKKQRVKVMEYWIETARECFNIGNFNSLMAIIAGLNMSPISRLKKTWSKVQSAKFSILEHQMDPSSNFSSYRSTLKAAMWRSAGATDERQRIVIPFFSLLVKDLYFLNEGCSSKLPNGHINFEKFWQLAKQVTEFITWKQVVCPFEKNTKVITFLQASPVLLENALAVASFECEPPDNNLEKERYKTLKAELSS